MNHKTITIAALSALALTAGTYALGHVTRPAESDPAVTIAAHCQELSRPEDPAGVVGDAWPDMDTCSMLSSSATIHSPADIAVRSAAEDIRLAQTDMIQAAHPAADPAQTRLTIQSVRGDLNAALAGYAVVAVGVLPVDYTETR